MGQANTPHPLNAPGNFYVVHRCCTSCDIPRTTAPELFAYDAEDHCYVRRQPANESELNKALRVLWEQELDCVRYRGSNEDTLSKMAQMGNAHLSDSPPQSS